MKKVFETKGDFAAFCEAEEWAKQQGYSVGSMCRNAPIGLVKGSNVAIAKWRNLTSEEKHNLDGRIEGDMRNGPAIVEIKD